MNLIDLAERRWLPDGLIRMGIRRLLRRRVREDAVISQAQASDIASDFAAQLRNCPLAVATDAANEQHYEVPAEFFQRVLGPRLKYSCGLFRDPNTTMAQAEEAMLRLTCQRAELADGQDILELGCGWGSLSLWMAEKLPNSRITAVSNSHSQREHITAQSARRSLSNLHVITADMRDFTTDERFDRVVSVEMFEHMQNHELLLERIAKWLVPQGKLFVHIFCRRRLPYFFQTEGASNWMGRHFFTGGIMPSVDLFQQFGRDLRVIRQWSVDGLHYARTCEAWLEQLDRQRDAIELLFEQVHAADAKIAVQRWRMFFMACAELFRFASGKEWFVSHYLLEHAEKAQEANVEAAATFA